MCEVKQVENVENQQTSELNWTELNWNAIYYSNYN